MNVSSVSAVLKLGEMGNSLALNSFISVCFRKAYNCFKMKLIEAIC